MKQLFITLVFLQVALHAFPQCAEITNITRFTYDGRSYEIVKELKNWPDAAACAVERGGYLVEINDAAEQTAVYKSIMDSAAVAEDYVELLDAGGIAYVWIGATDKAEEGTWLWDGDDDGIGIHFWSGQGANGTGDGSEVSDSYYNWGGKSVGTAQEPDNYGAAAGQDNAAIGLAGWPKGSTALGSAGEWNDVKASSELYYVIEYDNLRAPLEITESLLTPTKVYPNPTSGLLHIICEDFHDVAIFDICGSQIAIYKNSTPDLSGIPGGLYFIKIRHGKGESLHKVMVE